MFSKVINIIFLNRVIRFNPVLPFFLAVFSSCFASQPIIGPTVSTSKIDLPKTHLNELTKAHEDSLKSDRGFLVFKEEHAFKKLFIVFAGPYPSSPSSSFGHIFLLLEPKENDKPMLLWDAVNFSADADTIGSFTTFYKGIFGGLIGNYTFIPFHEKLREYTFIESRPLWIFPFEMNKEETDNFLKYLYKVQNVDFDYRFMDKNCASQIESLLQISIGDSANIISKITSPRDVLLKNPKLKARLKSPLFIESTESVIDNFLSEDPDMAVDRLKDSTQDYSELLPNEAAILLNILEWKYFRRKILLSKSEKMHLEFLRLSASRNRIENTEKVEKEKRPFYLHPPQKVGIGFRTPNKMLTEYEVIFRPGLHDFHDNEDSYPKYDFISLAEMNIGFTKEKLFLNEFWLFNQMSIKPISQLSTYISWKLAVGGERKIEFKKSPLSFGIYSGIGITLSLKKNFSTLSAIWHIDPVYLENYGSTILTGPELISTLNFADDIKVLSIFRSEMNLFRNPKLFHYFESSLSFPIMKENRLIFRAGFSKIGSWVGIQIFRYLD